MSDSKSGSEKLLTITMIFSMALWGGSWVSGKLAAVSAAPAVIIFWRFFLTALSLLPVAAVMKQSLRIRFKDFLWLFAAGSVLFFYNIFFFKGLQTGLAGSGGVLVTTLNPVLTFILTLLVAGHKNTQNSQPRLRKTQILGLVLGFSGGLVMLEVWHLSSEQLLAGGNLLFLGASLLWAALTLLSAKAQQRVPFIAYSIWIYAIASVLGLLWGLPSAALASTPQTAAFWLNMLYLSVGATSLATTVYFLATSRIGSRRASSFIFMVPASALLFSWLLLGERPSLPTLLGGALAITAVYVLNRR